MHATGSRVTGWLLVEVRGAWGEDAVHDSALGACVPADFEATMRRHGLRVLCIRSRRRSDAEGVRLFTCRAPLPGERASLWTREVGDLGDVTEAVANLVDPPGRGWDEHADPLVLVCTNGRHDQCCANLGRPLVRHLDSTEWGAHTWESSHVGGDRFAPNLVVLPDSLYFGRADPPVAVHLLDRWKAGVLDLAHFRGRTSLSFEQQAAEHHVRQALGVDSVDAVVVTGRTDDGGHLVRVRDERLVVRLRRHDVTVDDPLTCRGRPGQTVPQFELLTITPE